MIFPNYCQHKLNLKPRYNNLQKCSKSCEIPTEECHEDTKRANEAETPFVTPRSRGTSTTPPIKPISDHNTVPSQD